ncbi:uncharacterized protein Z518_11407 [Rhinocladiella mackenziei CBS 650.93]|uniref:EDC4-like protein pdc1 beta-propeller domain-containing protein n=1 Tax=Rhinocladiella mackenziei CBS 650.93 TaxID=1442369 RepID=A0A0D2IRQ3_9EURO|nr:uncharacterized protein Z518_11407 [Rhinocladiella mackenziei CBS 650.93]KIW99419.1 hypothetical protein Z518_11407 [Rhinocladiella mackenziei CBS 650.93]
MSTNDLQALFAHLRPKNRESSTPSHTSNTTHRSNSNGNPPQLSGSSPLPSSPPPFASVSSYNPVASQPASGSSASAQSLLNLLNFVPATTTSTDPGAAACPPANAQEQGQNDIGEGSTPAEVTKQASGMSGPELLAKLLNPPPAGVLDNTSSPFHLEDQGGGGGGERTTSTTSRDPSQDALLKLLSKAHPTNSPNGRTPSVERLRPQPSDGDTERPAQTEPPFHLFGPDAGAGPLPPFEESKPENKPPTQNRPIFTYTNPFEALNASRSQTPKSGTAVPIFHNPDVAQPSVESGDDQLWEGASRVATAEQAARRKIQTPRLPSTSKHSTVSCEASVSAPDPEKDVGEEVPPADDGLVSSSSQSGPTVPKEMTKDEPVVDSDDGTKHDQNQNGGQATDHQAEGGDEWEDAEDSPNKGFPQRTVPVYNFPIKPFVSITLQLGASSGIVIRDDGVMEISRLKKDFDQLDRSLAAATSKYITYALVKNGGMRIIRQDDGSDRQVFKNSHDRIFNVAVCTNSTTGGPSDDQAVLGTGVSGAVYYATISKNGKDLFEKNGLESESLIFPPYPPADENTAGGVLKTRAKRSSRHPEFFAIGRGKSIHLVWPAAAISPRYGITDFNRRVDVDKLFQERALQIYTGKAGKDFTFSEDDSVIVSLDKTGRLRFWDIRKLTEEPNATAARVASMTVDMPLLSLSTASPAEKSWPTSVLFVDKARPYVKGGALRYVLVGLRQNHTLQLWDIALGKAVQELNFPHENETDGICSVSYHANSGIIVVGHPTRNSLFFIHLSAPRYSLSSSLSQAVYVQRISMKDPELPKPESTACMSGIREISFAEKGQLRSVELLPIHRPAEAQKAVDEKTPLFELYVVHSKGVTCLNITKEDLGWNAESKVVHGIDAAKEGLVNLKELRLGSVIEEGPRGKSPAEEVHQSSKASKKKTGKKLSSVADRDGAVPSETQDVHKPAHPLSSGAPELQSHTTNGESALTKENKKSKKKAAQHAEMPASSISTPRTASPTKAVPPSKDIPPGAELTPFDDNAPQPGGAHPSTASAIEMDNKSDAVTVGISGDWLDRELKKVERAVSTEFRKELNVLYQNIQNDRMVQDSSSVARQEALLRLVSTTLTNNVEKALSRILAAQMHQSMVPALTGVTVQAVSSQVGEAVAKSLHSLVPHELGVQLPVAINSALQSPQMSRTIAETISQRISKQTESQLADLLLKQVVPAFKTLAFSTAEKAASEVEVRLRNEIRQLESDRRHDMNRLEKLGQVLQATAETLQQMSDTQVAFQGQILKDRRQLALLGENSSPGASRQVSTARMTPSPRPIPQRTKTKEESELEEIAQLMNEGRYEEGSIKWLQSSQPVELFDQLFIHFTPEYLATDVSPLIAFSIAITIGNSLTTNTLQRLEWISAAFNAVDSSDPEIADLAQHAPALLSSLIQKLESLYMTMAERDPRDPALHIMPAVSKKAKDMRASLQDSVGYGRSAPTL